MEDNTLTPSPMPTPDPGTSMPEFAAAPAQPAQPLPPASAMPDFGNQQPPMPPMPPVNPVAGGMPMPAGAEPVGQPVVEAPEQPAQPAQPVATETPTPEATPAQTVEAPEAVTENQLGEIMEAGTPDTESVSPVSEPLAQIAPAEKAVAPTPTPEKKKTNVKLISLISIAGLLVVGCVVAAIMLMNQPKPKNNPAEAPVATIPTAPDTSVAFDELTGEQAAEFLNALEGDATYFPEDYTDEDNLELIADKNIAMFYSYDKKDDILNIVKESDFAAKFKDKVTKDNVTITEKTGFAVVGFDADATKCGTNCTGLIFDKKTVDFYSEPYNDILTGIQSIIVHIMIIDHSKAGVEEVAPLIASVFMNKQKIYSTELKETNGEFEYIVNTLEFKDSKKEKVTARKTHFKVIATGEFLYMPDLTTETVL